MRTFLPRFIAIFASVLLLSLSHAKTVNYELTIQPLTVNFAGKEVQAMSVNGTIPGPLIRATEGDLLRIKVTNALNEDTSIHWHGLLVPNDMDGVPYVTFPPIKPGEFYQYEFLVKQSGTYWYHSHSGLQEQSGVYGPIVLDPKESVERDYDEEYILVLSDWTNERPDDVLKHLKIDADYYARKKGYVQSWLKVLQNGPEAVKIRFKNALMQMAPMDLTDIGYDAFLINGNHAQHLSRAKSGTRVLLRVINAGASSYFILQYSGGPMKVVAADGLNVQPFLADKIRIAIAETYDVVVTIPDNKQYEFRASLEDGNGYAIATFGDGELVPAPSIPMPNLVLMDMSHGGDMNHMGNMNHGSGMDDAPSTSDHSPIHHSHQARPAEDISLVKYLNNYQPIQSLSDTTLPVDNPTRTIPINLTGSMERFTWGINGKPMNESDKILIKRGENVVFIITNETMMKHPIHIHGHFFRVINKHGARSPLKHTVNVEPFETVTIEFEANEDKDWIFHCHNLYHMKTAMAGLIHYEGSYIDPSIGEHSRKAKREHGGEWYNASNVAVYTNFAAANTMFMNNDNNVLFEARHNYKKNYEFEPAFRRYFTRLFAVYAGGDFKREDDEYTNVGLIGLEYMLPLLVNAQLRVDNNGHFRLQLGSELQLTDRLAFQWVWNTDKEYTFTLNLELTKLIYASANYDSEDKFGIGLALVF